MVSLYDGPDDFEAEITILTTAEGGRTTPPNNYIRWDFLYAEEAVEDGIRYGIYPEFLDAIGRPLTGSLALGGRDTARMYIVSDAHRQEVHHARIALDTIFFMMEGRRKVARGQVTKLTGLRDKAGGSEA